MHPILLIIARGLISFISLMILTRLLGKHQVAQLTFFEYVSGITIGSIASSATLDLAFDFWHMWAGLVTWVGATSLMQLLALKSRRAAKLLNGEPTVLVMNGKVMEGAMRGLRYRLSDLLEELRIAGAFHLDEVQYAILEPNGHLSVLKKPGNLPVTLQDMNLSRSSRGISVELIYDGSVIEQNLQQVGVTREWLQQQLQAVGLSDPAQVFVATIDDNHQLFIDPRGDQPLGGIDPDDWRQ